MDGLLVLQLNGLISVAIPERIGFSRRARRHPTLYWGRVVARSAASIVAVLPTGNRTASARGGRPVAMLVSYDEWLALRETIAIVNDQRLIAAWRKSEAEIARGGVVEAFDLPRVRVAKSVNVPDDAYGDSCTQSIVTAPPPTL